MKRFTQIALATTTACLLADAPLTATARGQDAPIPGAPAGHDPNLSFKLEIQRAIDRGVAFLKTTDQRNAETGGWGDETQPAITALALSAIMGDQSREGVPAEALAGYEFLLSKVKKDEGGIYGKGLACYNTSLAMMALTKWDDARAEPALLAARRFLKNQQSDFDQRGETDNIFDGGVGYGGSYAHSDLSNTHFVLMALRESEARLADSEALAAEKFQLNWDAALEFVSRCQNLPESNKEDWVSPAPDDRGGMVYFPGSSKAGDFQTKDGRTALRSYASMSYAGLLSFVYAKLDENDPRMEAVLQWLGENYSVDENPGMGQEGLFYYYHTMAKALSILGYQEFPLADGEVAHWRIDLSKKLFSMQNPDGSWKNADGRWWENDPVLVTSYAVLALEHALDGM